MVADVRSDKLAGRERDLQRARRVVIDLKRYIRLRIKRRRNRLDWFHAEADAHFASVKLL